MLLPDMEPVPMSVMVTPHEISNGIGVGGVVGSIADLDIWTENNFQWGIMMIPQSFGDQKYSLITYWVEDNT